jgi:hypothetical protein
MFCKEIGDSPRLLSVLPYDVFYVSVIKSSKACENKMEMAESKP